MKKIYCLIGPSACGKTTLGQYLKKQGCLEIISSTTRTPREGEIEGTSYYFVTPEKFNNLNKIENVEYAGNRYCTSVEEIEHKLAMDCKALYVVVTYDGYEAIKKYYEDTVSVFIEVNQDECIQRMISRGDTPENIQSRINNFSHLKEFNNGPKCDVVINNSYSQRDNALKQLDALLKES